MDLREARENRQIDGSQPESSKQRWVLFICYRDILK